MDSTFLFVMNDDHTSILHGYRDTRPPDLDFLESRYVIGYVIIV